MGLWAKMQKKWGAAAPQHMPNYKGFIIGTTGMRKEKGMTATATPVFSNNQYIHQDWERG